MKDGNMVPVIRVSDDTFNRLKRFAEPLEDTPEDALRKVLTIAEKSGGAVKQPALESGQRSRAASGGRRPRTTHVLEGSGAFSPGTELVLLGDRLPFARGDWDSDDPLYRARVGDRPRARHNVIWDFDGGRYSLSALSESLREEHGVPLPEGGLNGYLHWGLAGDSERSLWEIAEEILEADDRPAAAANRGGRE